MGKLSKVEKLVADDGKLKVADALRRRR